MSTASVRRTASIAGIAALTASVAGLLPTPAHASSAGQQANAGAAQTQSAAAFVRRHTDVQLVRNGAFNHGRTHWMTSGTARPRIRIVHRGVHHSRAAKVSAARRGHAVLMERLSADTHAGDTYRAAAMVKPAGRSRHFTLQIIERKHDRVVGRIKRQVVVRHDSWRRLTLHYAARRTDSVLLVKVTGGARGRHSGFVADNVTTVQTLKVVPVRSVAKRGNGSTPSPVGSTTPTTPPSGTLPTSNPACPVSATLVPSCGAWWGVYKPPSTGENWQTTYTDLESQVGRTFDLVYRYHDMSNAGVSGQFPDKYEQALGANHILMFSWASRNFAAGTQLQWSDIAAGKYDASVIDPEAARLKAYGQPVFLAFDPEMDRRMPAAGTAADYVAAYRHIWQRFADDGVTNVIWVWTVTGYSAHDSEFASLYPGNSYVDWIGYDPYNFASCHSTAWKSFDTTVGGFYSWLESNGYGDKPFMLPEYGTVADPSDATASGDWYASSSQGIANYPNIKAVVEWDDTAAPCDTELNVDPGTMAGFAQAGQSPIFNQASGTD